MKNIYDIEKRIDELVDLYADLDNKELKEKIDSAINTLLWVIEKEK